MGLRPFCLEFLGGFKNRPFSQKAKTLYYAKQNEAVPSQNFLTPVLHGDLDHSELHNDKRLEMHTDVEI